MAAAAILLAAAAAGCGGDRGDEMTLTVTEATLASAGVQTGQGSSAAADADVAELSTAAAPAERPAAKAKAKAAGAKGGRSEIVEWRRGVERQLEVEASRRVAAASSDRYVAMAEEDDENLWNHPLEELPEPTIGLPLRWRGSYAKEFNDSNYVHWSTAEAIGIAPLSDTRSHWTGARPLVKIRSCRDFYIEPLTYSRPYLVPEAAEMLHEIGRRFRDTLDVRGGGDYRIRVTSVLRTPETVAKLRRRNRNAIDSSVHQLGTTIDISYARFAADSGKKPRSMADLKAILAEVLQAMRDEGKCWIKHEAKQPCFHITVRPNDAWISSKRD